ncbi:MAG: hypothetical protein NC217_04560 [Muribaculaceae bacterium]|nr:hypothetical protein [Muribaculaceae bacterium]
MKELKDIASLIERNKDMVASMQRGRKEMAERALAVLKEYGVHQVGFWSGYWADEFDFQPEYNEEDIKLFGDLHTTLQPCLWYGGDENEFEGKIIALRDENGTLQFVCANDLDEEMRILDVMAYVDYPQAESISFDEVMNAFVKSIEFNIDNNVPVAKWVITHYPPVNPYADEYLAYEK